ncbi:MAG: S1 RNA-binding domain-containing protein [Candidatus Melainabacteria bacterium]|nr:MAG: S1 RNA-binding domain-containing protein [Candidatus Melainabacteria bacterium]
MIIRDEDEEGEFLLSYKKVALAYNWKELETLKENNETVQGKVLSSVKGGVLVEVMGVRGFVPLSHLRSRDVQSVIGETLEFKILTMDAAQNNFILSNKKFMPTKMIMRKMIYLKNLKSEMLLKAKLFASLILVHLLTSVALTV